MKRYYYTIKFISFFLVFLVIIAIHSRGASSAYGDWLECRRQCARNFNNSSLNRCKPLPIDEQSECYWDINKEYGQCRKSCEKFKQQEISKTLSNFGGRITYTAQCIIEDPVLWPDVCNSCPMCTGLLGSGCANVTEIQFTPVPKSKWNYICPQKSFRYKGGGYPRIGGWILGNGYAQFLFSQIGASR